MYIYIYTLILIYNEYRIIAQLGYTVSQDSALLHVRTRGTKLPARIESARAFAKSFVPSSGNWTDFSEAAQWKLGQHGQHQRPEMGDMIEQ